MNSNKVNMEALLDSELLQAGNQEPPRRLSPEYLLRTMLRKRWFLLIPFCISLMVGIVYAIKVPKIYKAETLILVEPQRVPDEYIRSVATGDVESRVSTIQQQILSRTNLNKIINKFNLFDRPTQGQIFLEGKIGSLRRRISIDVSRSRRRAEADSFVISFRDEKPEIAMNVTNAIATSFINENLKVREEQAVGTSDFLAGELQEMRARLEVLEGKLQYFRKQHMGALPEQLESNLRILDRLQEQLSERQLNLREETNRLQVIQAEIAAMSSGTAADSGQLLRVELANEIAQHRTELKELQAKYTERHPDVTRLKRILIDREKELTALNRSSGDAVVPAANVVTVNNAGALMLRQQNAAQTISVLRSDIAELQQQMAVYETRVENTPRREQELLSLKRDYENMQNAYSSLLNRRLEAELAANLERKQKGEQFRILDPASLPEKPIEPNMKKLFFFFICAGLGLGGGWIFITELSKNAISSIDEVKTLSQLNIIATIPPILNKKDQFKKKVNWALTGICLAVSGLLLAAFAFLVHKGVDEGVLVVRNFLA